MPKKRRKKKIKKLKRSKKKLRKKRIKLLKRIKKLSKKPRVRWIRREINKPMKINEIALIFHRARSSILNSVTACKSLTLEDTFTVVAGWVVFESDCCFIKPLHSLQRFIIMIPQGHLTEPPLVESNAYI